MSVDVFISHSSRDEDIARALTELLRSALNIPHEKILCTSLPGHGFKVGVSVNEQLRIEVKEARFFIGLITPDSIRSPYVLFELGARWGAGAQLAPVLAAGAGSDLLQGPLSVLNALNCSLGGHVHQLVTDVANFLQYPRVNPESYEHHVSKLVEVSKEKGTRANPT